MKLGRNGLVSDGMSKVNQPQCTEKSTTAKIPWRLRNKERVVAIAAKCYQKNIEKRKAWQKEYRARNKEREAKRKIEWYNDPANHIHTLKRVANNYSKNADEVKAHRSQYAKDHRTQCNAGQLARRHIPVSGACELCSSTEHLLRHHPDYNRPLDVQIICKSCHTRIHKKSVLLKEVRTC